MPSLNDSLQALAQAQNETARRLDRLERQGTSPAGAGPAGTVTSVGLSAPSWLTVSGSPITTYGTLALSATSQAPNMVLAGPASGGAAAPTFRALVAADLPAGMGLGTVTQVGLAMPAIFTVTGTPVTTTGTLTAALANQAGHAVFIGPNSGTPAAPTFRALVVQDLPATVVIQGSLTVYPSGIFDPSTGGGAGDADFNLDFLTQSANTIFAGPASGGAVEPSFRAMVTADIPNAAVTYAKIQNVATSRLLGRSTAGAGVVEEIAIGSGLTLSGGVLDTAGGAAVTGTGTDTYLTRWTGASTVGDSTLYLSSGKIVSATANSGLKVVRTGADATSDNSADAPNGYTATMNNLAVDRDGGGAIAHRAGFSSDSLTEKTSVYGHLIWQTDATYDIGASGANRPRDAYLSRSLYAASLKLLGSSSGTATITPPAAAGTPTLTLPTSTGTLALTSDVTTAVSGTSGTIAKFTGTNVVGNSVITESGAAISVAGAATLVGQSNTNQFILKGYSTQTSPQILIQSSAAAELARIYVTSNYSIGIGYQAGQSVTGADNVAIGKSALATQTSGTANVAIGSTALRDCNSSGHDNVAIGPRALEACTSGQYNFAIGSTNLYQLTTAQSNMAVGTNALLSTTGAQNTAIGAFAGYYLTTGADNQFIGFASGMSCTGSRNIAIGSEAARTSSTSAFTDSTYIGHRSGYNGTAAGSYNVAIGSLSLQKNVSNAVAIGYQAGTVQTGAGFTAIGYQAGLLSTSGTNSTLIGSGAGASLTTNGGCVMIGYQAGNAETAANKLYIANSSTTTPLIYGDFSTPALTFNGAITLQDARNVTVGSTTGTKWGTATTEKQAWWNATPIVQPTTAVAAATFTANSGTAVNDASTFDGYTLKQVVKALRNMGLLA